MISEDQIKKQIPLALKGTALALGKKYEGKVRDTYIGEDKVFLITTDRISAFDKVLTTIPFKGQVLNQISAFWFEKTKDICKNHILSIPDPNVTVGKKVKILPIEVIIRGYLTGSAWRDYQKGNAVSGITLPEGMKKDQKFDTPLFTPSTKEEEGHDLPISEKEIVEKGIMEKELLQKVKETALELFKRGQEISLKNGMILVDTKYEFGLDGNRVLILADEIHTPDSSRYWYVDTYEELFEAGKDQRMLDKEYLRQWLIKEKNFMGDGDIPEIPEDIIAEVSQKYMKIYEEVTGEIFKAEVADVSQRIKENLKEYES
ncbi:phosphoribosylaminoimidazolesuccinocarboxamide synthase [Candidatus Woesearchaeota archaeon]|nr:phosphoribosylaminoimidazolesuccinocarboxamide synthase [Candidatus Woesearchaeota archaeon]